ncbi:extracellular solute-binding protein [Ruania alkalisoli]|uniref:Extracellular solute-binding protein n=1 Tax=Ruania alkalisoli TaxID=2779775 RepID=A0A7M1SXV0_9MICO|nr:extracellular solute-binding protein [Ruania alkalisoli]QOR71804.1 extracellular solute-binding protein [Ruania alkalisoli]
MTTTPRAAAAIAAALTTGLLLTACSAGDSADPAGSDEHVTITVGGLPPTENEASRDAMLEQVEAFNEAHPDITVEAVETKFDVETFNALLAGGTAPTVLAIPFTEIQTLIEREQVADVTDHVAASEVLSSINESVMDQVTGPDGNVYGVPYSAYSMGLVYNRAVFADAGLDPDQPPATWDEVRSAAAQITANTDAAGFVPMTMTSTGGWVLTTLSYAFGDVVQEGTGTDARATFADNGATAEALEFYRTLRWEDDSMGANFLVSLDDSRNALASGQVGMIVDGADIINDVVANRGMDVDDYGVTVLPQQPGAVGNLGGGAISIVTATASEGETAAGVQWMDWYYFSQYTDQEQAESWASARAEDGLSVSPPLMPILSEEVMAPYGEWIAPYVNVPAENVAPYVDNVPQITLVPEPPVKGQDLYAALDPVVQSVLTEEDADIAALLEQAQTQINDLIAAG